jgi:hypothetical protein
MKVIKTLAVFLSFVAFAAVVARVQTQDWGQDHDELRAMLKTATDAMNSMDIDAIAPLFHDKFSITTVDQRVFTSLNDFKTYFNGLFTGDKASLKGPRRGAGEKIGGAPDERARTPCASLSKSDRHRHWETIPGIEQ